MAGTMFERRHTWEVEHRVSMESGLDGRNNAVGAGVEIALGSQSQWSPA